MSNEFVAVTAILVGSFYIMVTFVALWITKRVANWLVKLINKH